MYRWITLWLSNKKQELLTLREHLSSASVFWWGMFCSSSRAFFCVVLLCVFTFWIPCCDVRYGFRTKMMFGSSLPPIVCKRTHVYSLNYVFCVYLCKVASNTYCVVFWLSFLRLVACVSYDASFSGLSIFDCPFSIL